MEDISLIRYKWEQGVYGLKEMVNLVRKNVINEEEFFDITRYVYSGVVESRGY